LVVAALVLTFSVALGQRAEDKTTEQKMKEVRKAHVAGGEEPAPARRLTTVYLRGDAVGQHLNYVPSATNMPTVQGELTRMDAEWVVVTSRSKDTMIARSAVLMVVIDRQ
jgi:hypothetical protein